MSDNALFMAIIGSLRQAPAVAAGIVPVDSQATAQTMTFPNGTTAQTLTCALPAGSAAGDVCILSCAAQAYGSFAWAAPATAITAIAPQIAGVLSIAVFAVTLVAADVTAGYIGVPCSISSGGKTIGVSVIADVRRNVAASAIDVVGALKQGSLPGTNPAALTAQGITTTDDGDLIQYALFCTASSVSVAAGSTPPDGWTNGAKPMAVNPLSTYTGYIVQGTHGPTGDITLSLQASSTPSGSYVTALISLRAYNPVFRLLGMLPATATVGAAWTGQLTLAGDYTSPVTVGGLPSWVGYAISGNTVSLSGTPPTAQAYNFMPVATDASGKKATGSAQSITASAASTSFSDNFSDPVASASNWPITYKGTQGNANFNGGFATLNPKPKTVSNVSIRKSGTYKSAAITGTIATNGANYTDYFVISIGTGAIANIPGNTTSWWLTVLTEGYSLVVRGAVAYLYKTIGGVSAQIGSTYNNSGIIAFYSSLLELILSPTGVVCKLNGAVIITSNDTDRIIGGNVQIAQGAYTSGAGGLTNITQATLQ